jgi:hypothetical protein
MKIGKVSFRMWMLIEFLVLFKILTLGYFILVFQLEKKIENTKPKPWLTTGIKISCANKRKLFLTYRCSNDPGYKSYYKKYCKVLSATIIAAKKKYYDEQILNSSNRTKTTWNIVKTVTNNNRNSNKIVSMNIDNHPNSNPVTITNTFITYFSSVARKPIKELPENNHLAHKDPLVNLNFNFKKPNSSLRFNYPTTTHEVNSIIHSLKTKDSYGYYEISLRLLKISAPYILSPLTHIFNKILCTGIFPERFKFSEIKPLFKKGSATEFSNYRPISLLTTFSKIIEKIINKRLYNYLWKYDILVNEQFGFREGLSTDTATYALINSVLLSLDKKHLVGGLLCDPQNAFDCVNHQILLAKLEFYGISGTANQLMRSYSKDRFQRVIIKDNMIVLHQLLRGIWSNILGPFVYQ